MPKIRLLLLFLLYISVQADEIGKPFISLYPSIETKGHLQNWGFIQDDRGVMYIGNGFGVQEYDGSSWRMILISNRSFAKSFAKDSSGRIYVGSAAEFGYLAPDARGNMQYVSLLAHVPEPDRDFNYIWFTHATPEGIYFQARERLFRCSPQSQATAASESWQVKTWRSDSTHSYFDSSFYLNGILWVHQRGKGLSRLVRDSLLLVPGSAIFAQDRVRALLPFPGKPGVLLMGTDFRGLYTFDGHLFQPFPTEADAILREGTLNDLKLLPDGSMAMATMSRGMVIISPSGKIIHHLTNLSGLFSNTISAVFLDRQKNLWLAMDGGIGVLENSTSLANFPFASGSSPNYLCRYKGRLYAATNDGLYYLDAKDSQFKFVSGIAGNQTNEFLRINGHLYVPGVEGIYKINGTSSQLVLQSGASVLLVTCLHRSRLDSNRIFAGSMGGIMTLRHHPENPNRWTLERNIPGFHEYIRQILEPKPGTLWLGTYDAGAIRLRFTDNDIDKPEIERFGPGQGLPVGTTSIFWLNERMVVGTANGMYQFDEHQQRFQPDPFFKGLRLGVNPSECTAATDAAGNIWVNAGKETVLYRKKPDGTFQMEKGPFSRFNDEFVNIIYAQENGPIWFGTSSGAIRFTPSDAMEPMTPYSALIRSVKLANDSTVYHGGFGPELDESHAFNLPYSLNALTFSYSATSYIKPEANEYKVRLEGFDADWSPWSLDTKRDYTNLPQGHYRFQVRARNIYGQESAAASFAFIIHAPWYNTWWALALYALLAAGFVLGVVRLRTRQLHERSRELEKIVQERTARIEEQKNNIEQLSRIGKDITATLSIENIIHTVYENVNTLMDAAIFGIGIYNEGTHCLDFPATMEKNQVLPAYSLPLSDENRLAVWCYIQGKDVIINDYGVDYGNYIRELQPPIAGENPESILYLPLVYNERVTGVITAQSFRKNAYTAYHLTMLRNLAAYSAIALDNADAYRKLRDVVEDLKATQEKLVTQSKLAALGALTAGIAHEIKNPLNFVNNFAELIIDLVDELREQFLKQQEKFAKDERAEIEVILTTLQQNALKVQEHGKRADSIVKSMLQHSRGKAGERQLTDLNAVLAEDINLAYHGMRAQDSSFNAKIETDLDPAVGKLNLIPQDVSRVFLNIISNGFYEAHRKKVEQGGEFTPTLTVSSKNIGQLVEVRIRDNGNGIPEKVREKLFTPFFTTKPTGKGTGLGLSLSYDIIVQQHGGELTFESQEGQFAEFIIRLPK